jgi:hypothetical protein
VEVRRIAPDIDQAVDGAQRSDEVVVVHAGEALVAVSPRAGGQRWPGTTAPRRLLVTRIRVALRCHPIRLADALRSTAPNISSRWLCRQPIGAYPIDQVPPIARRAAEGGAFSSA